jgi:hypothetical protein
MLADVKKDGGNIKDYFVRSSYVDRLGYSTRQTFGYSLDVDDPTFQLTTSAAARVDRIMVLS